MSSSEAPSQTRAPGLGEAPFPFKCLPGPRKALREAGASEGGWASEEVGWGLPLPPPWGWQASTEVQGGQGPPDPAQQWPGSQPLPSSTVRGGLGSLLHFLAPPLQVWNLAMQTLCSLLSLRDGKWRLLGVEGTKAQTNYSAKQLHSVLEVLRAGQKNATWASTRSRRGSPVGMFWQQGRAPPRPRVSQPHPASGSPSQAQPCLPEDTPTPAVV